MFPITVCHAIQKRKRIHDKFCKKKQDFQSSDKSSNCTQQQLPKIVKLMESMASAGGNPCVLYMT